MELSNFTEKVEETTPFRDIYQELVQELSSEMTLTEDDKSLLKDICGSDRTYSTAGMSYSDEIECIKRGNKTQFLSHKAQIVDTEPSRDIYQELVQELSNENLSEISIKN